MYDDYAYELGYYHGYNGIFFADPFPWMSDESYEYENGYTDGECDYEEDYE